MTAIEALRRLLGLQLVWSTNAADMREFGFASPTPSGTSRGEWGLHIQCPWRIEGQNHIITGDSDWFELRDDDQAPARDWNPGAGGSLQEARLRQLLRDHDDSHRVLQNTTDQLIVEDVDADSCGGACIKLSGEIQLRLFPTGSRGESWRLFEKGDLESHYVSEPEEPVDE